MRSLTNITAVSALALATACGGDPPMPPDPPRAIAIAISPESVSLASIGETATFTARITDQFGATFNGTVTWTSEDTDVFTVNAAGQVTAAGNGTGAVRASFQQLSATAQVTVRQEVVAITVSPALDTLVAIGDTATFTAVAVDANGHPVEDATVTWTSEDTDVFTVNAAGQVTAAGNGTGAVRASFQQLSATAQVTVRQEVVAITVSPALDTLVAIGDTATFTAVAVDANGHPVEDARVTWASSAPRIATVDADGVVRAVGEGHVTISAALGGVVGSATLVAATVIRIAVPRLDTTVVVPIKAEGANWSYTVTESRWLPEMPVGNVARRESLPSVAVEVLGPGWVQVNPSVSGRRLTSIRFVVAPPRPFVVALKQDDWPASDVITVRGYAVDRIVLPAFLVGGEPAIEAFGDSVEMRFKPAPLNGGECEGTPVGEGVVTVANVEVPGPSVVRRLSGPVAILEPGESFRLGGPDSCVRLWAHPGASYVLAGVERSAIDASRYDPSPVTYGGGAPYDIHVTDRTVEPSARVQLRRLPVPEGPKERDPAPPQLHPAMYSVQSDSLQGLDTYTEKWKVGDEFFWYTNDGREGVFRVVELYPPNVVFAVFKEDLDLIWTDARQTEFDEIMNWLGSEAQDLYKTAFGPEPPITNTQNEQMVVMYNAGSDDHSTGVMIHNIDGNRKTTTVHMRDAYWGDKWWYHSLAAHELAHAWHYRNFDGFVGPWATEGMANWFADENSRLATNTPLDANRNADEPLRGLNLRLPWFGDFLAGYRESHPYLRFLVTRLIFNHGQTYASAARRVMQGASEDWYGHYFIQWNRWDLRRKGMGLVERMREVVPDWDPVESRLDWMLSFALDDRSGLTQYDLPLIDRAWRYFPEWETIRMGRGQAAGGQSATGGNYYFLVEDPQGIGGSVHLEVTDGDASVEWKLVRYR